MGVMYIVIPARLKSARLPDKLLTQIGDRTVLAHVERRALEAVQRLRRDGISVELIVAVDDQRLMRVVSSGAMKTPDGLRSGTDRCAWVASHAGWDPDDLVVDLQADMPFIDPAHIELFCHAALRTDWRSVDVLTAFAWRETVGLDFQRHRDRMHVGMYAWQVETLIEIGGMESTVAEIQERLEQRRAADNGMRYGFVKLPAAPFEINTPEDLALVQSIMGVA